MAIQVSSQHTLPKSGLNGILRTGRAIFAFAIAALGVETLVCARVVQQPLGPGYNGIPVLPWLPAISWLGYGFGATWLFCAVDLLFAHKRRIAALWLAGAFTLCVLLLILPRYIASPGDMGLRTVVLEPLSLACIALLLAGTAATPKWLAVTCRAVFAIAMIAFGVDHFLGLVFIGSLLPGWIPWHLFWVGFFGVVFIACGIGIGLGVLERWSWMGIGTMFAIWVITLHVPRTLGFYSIPGAITDPDEWSSLFIAIGLWGGPWALAAIRSDQTRQP
jgi:hypothetical protein